MLDCTGKKSENLMSYVKLALNISYNEYYHCFIIITFVLSQKSYKKFRLIKILVVENNTINIVTDLYLFLHLSLSLTPCVFLSYMKLHSFSFSPRSVSLHSFRNIQSLSLFLSLSLSFSLSLSSFYLSFIFLAIF